MKKIIALIVVISALMLVLSACTAPEDEVLNSLGEYKSCEFYNKTVFADFTDYAKYYFDSVDFTDNKYFTKIKQSDLDNLNAHLDDFEEWIKLYRENEGAIEIVVHYDFDRAVIDCDDYLYIYSEQGDPWEDGNIVFYYYDVCFYDTQTNTLYRFKSKT